MHSLWTWTIEHLDRIISLIAILIAAYAILDVRKLFKELQRRDKSTETQIRQQMLTHFASRATFAFAAQFINFTEGQMGSEASIALLQAFHMQQLLAPDATKEQHAALRQQTREQINREAVDYARLIIATGLGTLKPGWDLPEQK